ncbi:polysaccharide lyase [Candidatus Pelagibacter sp.]|jgi:hypothetical protein|uniref:heparin lyase I family protein n=1 Tax=Pelagibacter ubique TaxID=198252 RepID=UPI0003F4C6D6|nr:heparin lyase I family protein [Candidatus Pelagibacter ubique]MDA8858978.1 polysaccharide lyase [Candidatus Pelagibacter sp.]MDB9940534.1 polysaccharide lyase [Candidatus Pelagibacter sp.]MDB9983745.1 polysaccharide lyase [Candidatus Pelagibacter sp.]MDC0992293.1 heparin lyase I family protein [Candidatus Pelagibacter sp.]
MKKLLIIFLLIPTLALSGIFKDDEGKPSLKTSSKSGFTNHSNHMGHNNYNFQYIKNKTKARAGKYFQRFEVRDGDCFGDDTWNDCKNNRERVEFSAEPQQRPIKKQCYGYSLMLSKDFIDTHPTNTTLGQVHQIGGPTGTAQGLASFPPLIQIDARLGGLHFNWHKLSGSETNVIDRSYYYELKRLRKMKEVWTDISFCLDFENERMDVWVDGIQKVKILKSPIFFTPKEIYFKHGIYRSFISKYKERKNSDMPTQVVFYDEIRRGDSIEKVDININPKLKPVD